MKNIEVLYTPEEIHQYMYARWKTPLFRDSHLRGGFVHEIVEAFARYPKAFFDPTDATAEKAHFSPWWGMIQNREYDNDFVHDLYLLHEIKHAGKIIYISDLCFDGFARKMQDSEDDASVYSEIISYFAMPGLRSHTATAFGGGVIYADRFLQDPHYHKFWEANPKHMIDEIFLHRRNTMLKGKANDPAEAWIQSFNSSNEKWREIWRQRYNEVEAFMMQFHSECDHAQTPEERRAATDKWIKWISSPEICRGTDIPFPQEAYEFASVYWRNDPAKLQQIVTPQLAV
ncbi:MAG: hypothetical protein GC136_09340 [Alphaproteobacteria bacterium]|nr:hypothetical protein [Alphaproteobacteria bacterium]